MQPASAFFHIKVNVLKKWRLLGSAKAANTTLSPYKVDMTKQTVNYSHSQHTHTSINNHLQSCFWLPDK